MPRGWLGRSRPADRCRAARHGVTGGAAVTPDRFVVVRSSSVRHKAQPGYHRVADDGRDGEEPGCD